MDAIDELPVSPSTTPASTGAKILRFVVLASVAFLAVGVVGRGLIEWAPNVGELVGVPGTFFLSAGLLAFGSWTIHRSLAAVRRERQRPFRTALVSSVAVWSLFGGVQLFAIEQLLSRESASDLANAGSLPFAIGVVAMHALHAAGAIFALCWVTVQATNDRYDHEYYRPVGYIATFWHFLGFAWLSALGLMAVAL